jgi:surface polysaccharide O-acyltransferase-like enzyme
MVILKKKKPNHRYEADIMRGIIVLSVVAMHTVGTITYIDTTEFYSVFQYAILILLRYNRQAFIFITAFVLVYVYNRPDLNWVEFWKKRTIGIIIPYVIWSIIYVAINVKNPSLYNYVYDTLLGSSSYQMYYILLAIQLYLLLPFFIKILNRIREKAIVTLVSLSIFQILLMSYTYYVLRLNNTNYKFTQRLVHIQYRFILFYLIYIFLGGFFALYYKDIEKIIKKNYKKAITFLILSILALLTSYVLEIYTFHLPIDFASAFDQPLVITYSLALIIIIFKLSIDISKNKIKLIKKFNKQIVKFFFLVSEAAFGIYLIHPIILNFVSSNIIYPIYKYNINTPLIGFFSVFIGWILTVLIVLTIVLIIMQIPYLNILVGKYSKYERKQNKKTPMLDTQI